MWAGKKYRNKFEMSRHYLYEIRVFTFFDV